MTSRHVNEDAFAVPDSTDWLHTPLTSLSAVEAAMRCQVCKDFYQTPMITSCAHTFCSVCIRRCLSTEGKCPACRSSDQELKLRFNGAMEEAVQAFIKGREVVLEFARTPKEQVIVEVPERRKRRDRDSADYEDEATPRKRTRASTRQQSQSQSQQQQSQSQRERMVIVDSEDDGGDFLPEGFTHCPICSAEVEISTINSHIDRNCVDPPTSKSRPPTFQQATPVLTSKPPKPLERLPQVNYSMMKDVPLRKKLTDAGLSAAGSRQLLQQRYSEWITLWNANCDATRPKTKHELKREMDTWERTQGGRSMGSTAGSQIRDKDFDGAAWSSKHDNDFKNLIANARKKVKATTPVERKDMTVAPENTQASSRRAIDEENPGVLAPQNDEAPVNGTTHSTLTQEDVVHSLPAKESSQRSRYFQEKEVQDDNDIQPPSSQRIIT